MEYSIVAASSYSQCFCSLSIMGIMNNGLIFTVAFAAFVATMNKLLDFWMCGVIDLKSYEVSMHLPQDGRRAVVQTPGNRLMAQQARCIYVVHCPSLSMWTRSRCPNLPAVVCSETAKRGRVEHWTRPGLGHGFRAARAGCQPAFKQRILHMSTMLHLDF